MVLLRLFAWLDRVLGTAPDARPVTSPRVHAAREPLANVALLSVDGGGQSLLCGAERITMGHLRAGRADLGFLADVGAVHAELVRTESLLEGPGWSIVPVGAEPVRIDGRPVPSEGRRIAAGARVRLGENLEFRLLMPDPASASAVLELLHGVECAGARHVVLLSPSGGGRVHVGSSPRHHVRVPGLETELELEWNGSEIVLRGEAGDAGGEGAERRLSFPPRARVALVVGKARGSRPPFGLSLEPVERYVPGKGAHDGR